MNIGSVGHGNIGNQPSLEESKTQTSEPAKQPAGEMLHYSTESPVKEMPADEVSNVIGAFQSSVGDYRTPAHGSSLHPGVSEESKHEKSWNVRNDGTISASDYVESDADDELDKDPAEGGSGSQFFKYSLGGGHTAAVMSLKHSDEGTEVSALASHPGTHGAGTTMIEKAANESIAPNKKLNLRAFPEAVPFYKSVGFQETDKNDTREHDIESIKMHLDPSTSNKWSKGENGELKLKGLEGKKYGVLSQGGKTEAPQTVGLKRPHEEDEDDKGKSVKHPRK